MCSPAAVGTAGTALQAYSMVQQGRQAKRLAGINAGIAEQNAADNELRAVEALRRGGQEEEAQRRQTAVLLGRQRAALAAGGVDTGSGTALNLQEDAAAFGEQDAQTIRDNALREAWGYRRGAENYRVQAAGERLSGKYAARAGQLNAIGAGLGSGGSTTALADFGKSAYETWQARQNRSWWNSRSADWSDR